MKRDSDGKRTQRKLAGRLKRHRSTRRCCIVYGLYDSSNRLRYIGQTRLILPDRLKWLFKNIRKKLAMGRRMTPVEDWALTCEANGESILISPIDSNATWDISEIIHIDRARQRGENLLNILRGGNDNTHDLALSSHESNGGREMPLLRGAKFPSPIDTVCALCGTIVSSVDEGDQICRDMDFDGKSCPHCCRTYGEARREEGLLMAQG